MKTFLIIALLVIGFVWFVGSSYTASLSKAAPSGHTVTTSHSSKLVTLHAAAGNSIVQMFDSLSGTGSTRTFPDGYTCARVGSPTSVTQSGVKMSFTKLSCDGHTGYVNSKWIRQ